MLGPGVDGARRIGTPGPLCITEPSPSAATEGGDQVVVEQVALGLTVGGRVLRRSRWATPPGLARCS
jgi:hypothetical protein